MQQSRTIYHNILANYFSSQLLFIDGELQKKPNIRKCVEQPYQQTKAELWNEVTNTLCNLDFIQAKACAKMTYNLVRDFNDVMEVIPDNAENIRQENARMARMDKYTRDLIAYAKGDIPELEIPDNIPLRSEVEIKVEIELKKKNPTQLDRLVDFVTFLGLEAGNLQNFAHEFPHFTTQQAWNYADIGPVGKEAEKGIKFINEALFHYGNSTRPQWNPYPQDINTLKGHNSLVTSISITPNAKFAISGSLDKICFVWDLKTVQPIKKLTGHKEIINDVGITPDGKLAISGSQDGICIIWDLDTGGIKNIFEAHSEVNAVSITSDGKFAMTGGSIGTDFPYPLIFWDVKSGKRIKLLKGPLSSVKTFAMTPNGKYVITGDMYGNCLLWDVNNGLVIYTLRGHSRGIAAVDITPDGKRAISCSYDNTSIIWDLTKGNRISTLKHTAPVCAVSITPDGKRAITGLSDQAECIIWDLVKGENIKSLLGIIANTMSVCITPDGSKAISVGEVIGIIWNLNTPQTISISGGHSGTVECSAVTSNNKIAVTGSADCTCIAWNLETGQIIDPLLGHTNSVDQIAITPDGKIAITGSGDMNCLKWYLSSSFAHKVGTFNVHTDGFMITHISITPDGNRVISGTHYEECFWELISGNPIYKFRNFNCYLKEIVLSPDGTKLITASENNCTIWDLKTGNLIHRLVGHKSGISVLAITPDGKIIITGSYDNNCNLWNLNTGKLIKTLNGHTEDITTIAITPDGKKVITGSSDKSCIIWELLYGQKLSTLTSFTSIVFNINISPDGKRLIAIVGYPRKYEFESSCVIYDLESLKKLSLFISSSKITTMAYFLRGILLGEHIGNTKIFYLNKDLLCPSKIIVTIRKIWDFKIKQYLNPSADCLLCGKRFEPPTTVLTTIEIIIKKAGLRPEQSPCLELPDEAWEDLGLLGNCPNCGTALKFNPFIAGN